MTQNEMVYQYMQKNGSITSLEAMNNLGIIRLSARIYDLRKNGVKVKTVWKKVKNRRGENCEVKAYSIDID